MTQYDSNQFDQSLIGADGPDRPVRDASGHPWRLNDIRVDGLGSAPPPFQAGHETTLTCRFRPIPNATDHIQRYQRAKAYNRYAGEVSVYPSQGSAKYWESHPGIDGHQLALLAPLESTARGDDPTFRASVSEALWVVVTGVEDQTMQPDEECLLDIDVGLIARWSEFQSRQAVRDAFETTGYGVGE